MLCASGTVAQAPASNAREFLTWLVEADEAKGFEERLHTHERALDAILKSDPAALEAVLALWCSGDERNHRNEFGRMAWTRLAQIDTARALRLLENASSEVFYEGARSVWAEIARTDPVRAYIAAQGFVPKNEDQRHSEWIAQHIMRSVGASWFRVTGLATLKRLPTLSHPDLMATAVFHGCVDEAKTAEQKIALLDRYAGDEKPVIEENHSKSPHLCEELVRAAALADLPRTRAWVEKRFPRGMKRLGYGERDWHFEYARRALFYVWRDQNATAAADWLLAQQHPDEDSDTNHAMSIASVAIAGADRENMSAALAWLEKQARPQGRVIALVDFLDDDFGEDTVLRQSREKIAVWLSQRPMAEREAVVLAAAKEYIRPQDKGDFLSHVFTDPAKLREMAEHLEQITGPATSMDGYSTTLRVFDLPARDKTLVVSDADAHRSRELARLHEFERTSADPVQRREGLEALKWMKSASPEEFRSVLLAYLRDHDMDWFSEDLLSAWVLQDWRSCEAFATDAPFPVAKRNNMLIHVFCEAAELFPDVVLARLHELIEAKVVVQSALDWSPGGSRVKWKTIYRGDMITDSLARGFLHQGDMNALAKIQTLPPRWQLAAFEVLYEHFTTPECGKALLVQLEAAVKEDKQRRDGVAWDHSIERNRVIERLADISPAEAVRWIETQPELLSEHEEMFRPVHRVHAAWRRIDPKAADAWMERVKRENPPKKHDPSERILKRE